MKRNSSMKVLETITLTEWQLIWEEFYEFKEYKESLYNGDIRREVEECFTDICCDKIRQFTDEECELIVEEILATGF